ncbi:hypothetical protein [Sphingomonas sp.]|uniref:hypothetical protein n=1 Tax=Sphingomonas sp. TaxID=28214 RepID=UPI0025D2F0B2|nr:hypothetical protein [Sphingomonas sp.]
MIQFRPAFRLTWDALESALGYECELDRDGPPFVKFELGEGLKALEATDISAENQAAVETQMLDCYRWCAARFPLMIRNVDGKRCSAIRAIRVGQSAHAGEYLTASSPQCPYTILVAAPWPISSRYRLASLLAHEALHQALYNRERGGIVARLGSLAYSPWKQQLRPGRLVWHAFWTFSGQFIFMAEAIAASSEEILSADPSILDFLAEMEARIECCAESVTAFEILALPEAERSRSTLGAVRQMGDSLAGYHGYIEHRVRWTAAVHREVDLWSSQQALARETVRQPEFNRLERII